MWQCEEELLCDLHCDEEAIQNDLCSEETSCTDSASISMTPSTIRWEEKKRLCTVELQSPRKVRRVEAPTESELNTLYVRNTQVFNSFRLLVEREDDLQPSCDYMMTGTATDCASAPERTRTDLMNWVLHVSSSFNFNHITDGHIVSTIDRMLDKMPVKRNLARVGLACILISSKFVGNQPACVDELQHCDPGSTADDILEMERKVLDTLEWELHVVTASEMLHCITSQLPTKMRKFVTDLSEVVINLGMSEGNGRWWLGQRRSTLALGAVLASLHICDECFPDLHQFLAIMDDSSLSWRKEIESCMIRFEELHRSVTF